VDMSAPSEIGVAKTRACDFNYHLAWSRVRLGHFLKLWLLLCFQ